MNIQEIEQAAFASWPAIDELHLRGVVLRSNGGYTKRANCANLLADFSDLSDDVIDRCDAYYRRKKQRAIYRLLSTYDLAALDEQLQHRGFEMIEKSRVMIKDLQASKWTACEIEQMDVAEWIDAFYVVSDDGDDFRTTHLQMLEFINSRKRLAAVRDADGNRVALGVGVVENGYFGIFNIVTAPHARRQGFSHQLISGLFEWAVEEGAHTAYLQVREENAGAVALYEKLGYRPLYHYWYRVEGQS